MKHLMTMVESHNNIPPSIGFQTKTGSRKAKILQPREVHYTAVLIELIQLRVFSLV